MFAYTRPELKIATWNVNSLKVRMPHLLQWLEVHKPEVVCLQETKSEDASFPAAEIEQAGYRCVFSGQKTYNGVAILSTRDISSVSAGIADYQDEQKRVLSATIDGVRIICVYVPNGQSVDSDKYQYKLGWLAALHKWLGGELKQFPQLAILGDYNIAPADEDVHDPKAWQGQVLCSEPERNAFRELIGLGLKDSFRLFPQAERSYTWWDYRMNAFKRKLGLRIDHILASDVLAAKCKSCSVDVSMRALERPSDHAPVIAEFQL